MKKKQKILKNLSKKQCDKYLLNGDRIFPIVSGSEGLYVIDHHHLGLALIQEKTPHAYGELMHDWSKETPEEFWVLMESHQYVYLKDEKGRMRKPQDLPKKIVDLKDDPYRSLAYFVKKEGGFIKDPLAFYIEFQWADFFRTRVTLGSSDKDFEKAVRTATKLAHTPAASHLPGYIPQR